MNQMYLLNIPETYVLIHGILTASVRRLEARQLQDYKPLCVKWFNTYPNTFNNEKILPYFKNKKLHYFNKLSKNPNDTTLSYKEDDECVIHATWIIAGIYYLYLIFVAKSDILKDYRYRHSDIIEDLVVSLLLHKKTNELLLTLLEEKSNSTEEYRFTKLNITSILAIHAAVFPISKNEVDMDKNAYNVTNIDTMRQEYPFYEITRNNVINALQLYSPKAASSYKLQAPTTTMTTSTTSIPATNTTNTYLDDYLKQYHAQQQQIQQPSIPVPRQVHLIDSLNTFLNKGEDSFFIYLEEQEKAISVKEMIAKLFEDVQSYNCVAPNAAGYKDCVDCRSGIKEPESYTKEDILTLLQENTDNNQNKRVIILNTSSLPDELYYANKDYIKRQDALDNERAESVKKCQERIPSIKTTLIEAASLLIQKRKEYVLALYEDKYRDKNEDKDKDKYKEFIKYREFITALYDKGTIGTEAETMWDYAQIVTLYNKDIQDILNLFRVTCKNVLAENTKVA